jgi:D-serine deaminase-like pyridoxal phosphate-dependent protein
VKTAKSIDVWRCQQRAGATRITVSTLKEAEQFFAAGVTDILYAVGIAPGKLDAVRALRERGCALTIILDSEQAADAVAAHARRAGHAFDVLIEIDSDGHRAGVLPDDPRLLSIAARLRDGGCRLLGVMTHAGGSYACRTPQALQAIAEQERARTVDAAQRLRAAGFPVSVVSVGSTPTALSAQRLDGVTEVRAGVYAFFDLVMAGVGVCTPADIALSVLTTVIGHQDTHGWLIVDAGWMAMSRDRGTHDQPLDQGYGLVCDVDGRPMGDWILSGANQEHGIVSRRDGGIEPGLAQRFPVGTRLRVLPNHACATAAQYDAYHAIDASGRTERWPRFGGW